MNSPIAVPRFFYSNPFRRNKLTKRIRTGTLPRRKTFLLEPLESRLLLSVDLIGVPDWVPQGPAPTTAGQVQLPPVNPVSGSVQAVAAHPTDANTIFAGAENGGIWRTTDGGTTWTPLTDQYPSLSIGSLAYSPLDGTNNTLFAGTGNFTNGFNFGNLGAVGLLRTTDGGNTWTQLGQANLTGLRIRAVVPTATNLPTGQLILVATIDGGGVWRSVDGGANFTPVSGALGTGLPGASATDLIVDPNNPDRFYAAVPGQGVFMSSGNNGTNWAAINTGLVFPGGTNNIELSAHDAGATTVLYVGVVANGALSGVFRDTAGGDGADTGAPGVDDAGEYNFTAIGAAPAINPGNQGFNNFTILADRTNNNLVYVGGDRQAASPFVGNLFIGNSNTNTWASIVLGGANNTAPHADSRAMVFDANNNIIEGNDGGIVRLNNPTMGTRTWVSINGNLEATQFYSVSYDNVNNIIFGGTQDTGSTEQSAAGSLTWNAVNLGDGGITGVANGAAASVRYTISNNFMGNSFVRRSFDNTNSQVGGTTTLGLNGLVAADQNFAGFTIFPYVINSINSQRLLLGGLTTLYESTDQGDNLANITPAGAAGQVSAMAYGGLLGGVGNADVAYVAFGANLFLRTTPGGAGAFNQLAAYTGGAITDIVLDPDNWQRAYVLAGNGVFFTPDAGATFTPLTGNLGQIASAFQSITLFSPGPAAGDEVVVVGGLGGVFRTRNPFAGNNALWTEFGGGLPNVQVTEVFYDVTDEALIVGTYGRGAWKILDADASLPVAGVLQVVGDEDFFGQDDTVRLVRQAANPSLVDVFLNSVNPVLTVQLSVLEQINVFGLGGNDTLIVESTNGLINVPLGIRYDGGSGNDQLQLVQTGGPTHTSDTYSVGPAGGSGISTIVGAGMAGTQTVFFEDLAPVIDLVAAALLTVNATATDNAINYTVGSVLTNGRVTIDEHESIEFSNKTSLVINAGAGQDTIGINNSSTPTGLTGITVNGGDPSSGDTLVVTGVGVAVTLNTATSTITGATGAGGAVAIGYGTLEAINLLSGIGDLILTTTGADDTVVVTPGLAAGSNSGTLQSNGIVLDISFANSGVLTANLGGGDDAVVVNGSSNNDTVAVSGAAVAITERRTINYTTVEALTVNGRAGSDTFNVTPSAAVAMFIDGGDPVGTIPGDLLNIIAGGGMVTYNAGPETDEGSFVVGANQPVSFDHIESFGITGSGPAVINGTNGPDAITVIARDVSTHAGANGVQDFTVSVNGGPELLFINVNTLTVNALGGSDQVTLQTPAPNNAGWDVDVTVNGGLPAGDTDRLIVQTPVAGAETATYTPTAFDGGTLALNASLSSLITINTIEVLIYDGQGDNDTLTVEGTGSDDTIVHMPGTNNQAGSFQVNDLLAISYQNLGGTGSLTADGDAGTDRLVYYGTAGNDTFTIESLGEVKLNARLLVNQVDIEELQLEGFGGNDLFKLMPAISAVPYSTLYLNGGGEASAAGDRVNLVATAGDDAISISGQTVELGGKMVVGDGIEDLRLDALGGTDTLTYTGVEGVTESISIAGSTSAGSGKISVPGVVNLSFTNAEHIVVDGNPGDNDTLTFVGTNSADRFEIDLAAAGDSADPVLMLKNTAGTTTYLTLDNYSGIDTLRVSGLDGADIFNVFTADGDQSRNLFVDGDLPAGKKKSTDKLNVFYTAPRPRIIHSAATQDPDAGLVDLAYGTARFLVQYDGIEQVVIARA